MRQRGGAAEKGNLDSKLIGTEDRVRRASSTSVPSEKDFQLGLLVITILSFITRFWGIGHPDQVVFDEVHFGKVFLKLSCYSAL